MTESSFLDINQNKYDFKDDLNYLDVFPKGLSKDVVIKLSKIKNEPEWMLNFRLKAFDHFLKMEMPIWGADLSKIDFNDITYYMSPNSKVANSWDDVPDNIKKTFDKLGIPESEKKFLAGAGAMIESTTAYHKLREDLEKKGVIFCDTDTAIQKYPDLVKKYFGTVIPIVDNKFSALNSAVWSGGSFIYVPKNVKVDLPLQAYFRINAQNMGQFERTLIIVDEGAEVSYIEGCSAPSYSTNSLHSAVVEVVALKDSRVRYTTLQNWSNNIYNLVTKRAHAFKNAYVEWLDANLGSFCTMKYPSVYLRGEYAKANILSVAFANSGQHQDAGAKALHFAPNTSSTILSKSISKGSGKTTFRGLIHVSKGAKNSKAHMKCVRPETLLLGDNKPISDYNINDTIIGSSGINKVNDTFVSDFKGDMIKIRGAGLLPFDITKEHPLFVAKSKTIYYKKSDGKYSTKITLQDPYWENSENLIPKKSNFDGHYLIMPRLIGNMDNLLIDLRPFMKNENIANIVSKDLPINEDTAWLMGLYVAEGSGDDQGHVKFSLNKNEKNLMNRIIRIARDLGYSSKVYEKEIDETMDVNLFSVILSRAFRKLFGSGAKNKKIPDFILLHKEIKIISSFLDGYFMGDGCLSNNCMGKKNIMHMVTVSKFLPMQIQLIGARLGIFFRITKAYNTKKGFIQGREVNFNTKYEIRCNSSKSIQAKITDNYIFIPIRSIEEQFYEGKVCNIETEDNTYLVNNIITHNCDALLIDKESKSDTIPSLRINEDDVSIGHEATVGKVGEDQLFYLMSRGLSEEQATTLIVSGFFKQFTKELPLEYALEFTKLIEMEMKNASG